jgi:hypothetical protein
MRFVALHEAAPALSGHCDHAQQCPLLGVKQTSRFQSVMSAFDPKQTLARASSHRDLSHCSYAMTMFIFDLNQILDHRAQYIVVPFF